MHLTKLPNPSIIIYYEGKKFGKAKVAGEADVWRF